MTKVKDCICSSEYVIISHKLLAERLSLDGFDKASSHIEEALMSWNWGVTLANK